MGGMKLGGWCRDVKSWCLQLLLDQMGLARKPQHKWDFGAFHLRGYKSVDFTVNESMLWKLHCLAIGFVIEPNQYHPDENWIRSFEPSWT